MSETTPIRVMLVDDHAVVRSGLTAFLLAYDDLELVGEASSGEQAVHLCGQMHPDVALMDLVMPGMDGATATGQIREKCPDIQVIALTSFKERNSWKGHCKQVQLDTCSRMCRRTNSPTLSVRQLPEGRPWPRRRPRS